MVNNYTKVEGSQYSTHLSHATMKLAQCRYQLAADTSA